MKKALSLFLLIFLSSCLFDNHFIPIDDDFEVGYVNMPKNRNIYYRSQGILNNETVVAIGWEADIIFIKSQPENKSTVNYYLIYKSAYKLNPEQMKSNGLQGPLDSASFCNELRKNGLSPVNYKHNW